MKAASKQKKEPLKVHGKVSKTILTTNTSKVETRAKSAILPVAKVKTSKPDKKLISYVINGKVSSSNANPQPGLTVKAFDRNVGVDDKLLGQATTDAQGHYSITYTTKKLSGKATADLVICLFQDGKLLQMSDVIFNAGKKVTRDFIIPTTSAPEFTLLTKTIQPFLRNKIGIGGLAQAQINFLGQKTGMDTQKIGRIAQSHALAGGDQTLATFYYGLLSQNIPTEPAALLSRPRESVQTALDRAVIFNQIPQLQPQDIDNILNTTLPKLRAENLLKPAPSGQKASLGDLLKTMPQALSDDDQMKVANLVAQNGIDPKQLPDQLNTAGFSQEKALGIERTLLLADVTLNHLPLMHHLQQVTATDPDGSLKTLTELGRDQWIDKVYAYGTPAGTDQAPEAYANQLERAIDTLYPTAMLAARLNSGDLVITRPGFEKAGTFLNNNPDFDILHSNIPVYVEKANFSAVENKDQLIKSLLKLQRVKRLSASWDEAGAMLNAGLESALDVVGAGKSRLIQNLSDQVTTGRASFIYERAQKVHDVSLMLMSGLLPRFSPTPIAALGGAKRMQELDTAEPRSAVISGSISPTLQSLFGSLDTVACDQTVLSPAAYYVDLLQFLNPKNKGETRNPAHLEALLARRPDLVDLQLSSKNTETELPYIDLVLEILENAVALPIRFDLNGTDGNAELGKNSLEKVITNPLQQTSLGTIGNDLKAKTEDPDQGKLTNDLGDTWIVDDQQRRWTLQNYEESLILQFSSPLNTVQLLFNDIDRARFISELKKAKISKSIRERIEARIPLSNRKSKYLFISDFYISTISPGTQWHMDFSLGVKVLIGPEKSHEDKKNVSEGSNLKANEEQLVSEDAITKLKGAYITLQTPSGKPVFEPRFYSSESIRIMTNGLKNGAIAGPLRIFLPPELKYVISQLPDGSWIIYLYEAANTVVSYQPDQLRIMALTYQTMGKSDDLIACPENQNPIAYEILRNPKDYGKPVFPWSLPFNLPWETVRACLERAGVSRRRLMELTDPEQYLTDSKWAYETLGISTEEAALIVNPAADDAIIWNLWGLQPDANNKVRIFDAEAGENVPQNPADPSEVLSRVSILMQQARLSYEDMLRVLKTFFVGAYTEFEITIIDDKKSDRGPCNLMMRNGLTKMCLDSAYFDRMHRFIRLWRKLGWEIEDVDRAIKTLDSEGGDISEGLLTSLVHILRLQELLDAPASLLVGWWGDMLSYTHSDIKTLYEQIFLNPLVQNPPDEAFLLKADRTALLNSGNETLGQKSPLISAALGIAQNDISQLQTLLGMDDEITLTNLFELYRIVSLARALGISISDYSSLISLTAATPFINPLALIEFCQTVEFILNSGFGIQELAYLLQQDASASSLLGLTSAQVSQKLKSIRLAMQTKLGTLEPQVKNIIANNPGGLTVCALLSPDASMAVDAAALAIDFAPGDSASGVTMPLTLPENGNNGTTVKWKSDDTTRVEDSTTGTPGLVHRIGKTDASVTLTATIETPSISAPIQKAFTVVVLAELADDQQAVAADAAALSIGFIHKGDSVSSVTGDLILPGKGNNGTSITWNTPPDQNAVLNSGIISRPTTGSPDAVATLTATVKKNNASIDKSFTVVVRANLTDEQSVTSDAASLAIEFPTGDSDSSVTGPFALPASGANGTIINWTVFGSTISNPNVITILPSPAAPATPASAPLNYVIAGVTRPPLVDSDAYVVLAATINKNDAQPTKKFFYPQDLLVMDPLDADRLALVLDLTDPNDEKGLNVPSLLRDVIVAQVTGLFGLEIPVARKLLTSSLPHFLFFDKAVLTDPSDSAIDAIEVFFDNDFARKDGIDTQDACDLMHRLQKISLLLLRLKVKPAEMDWISPPFGMLTLDLNKLPLAGTGKTIDLFSSWQELITLFQIRDLIPGMGSLLGQYVTQLINQQPLDFKWNLKHPIKPIDLPIKNNPIAPKLGDSPSPKPVAPDKRSLLAALIGEGLGLAKEWDYKQIAGSLGLTELDHYRDPLKLEELVNLFSAMKKLGATMTDINLLTQAWPEPDPSPTMQDPATQAEIAARALLRSKYGADSWNGIIKPISDKLRLRQRDVLVDYLIFNTNSAEHPIKDVNDLYEYYLIDPQMSPCMLTSRLVQATASVQLFVQRCLLNLETAKLNIDDRGRWEWMKNYRVWQANREVFLFPENWLFPELRDDKTETFKALESGLNQGEPKDQLAKDNVLNYLDELNEISKISVYGMYEDVENDVLYIVGRSPNQPYNYYWRKCTAFGDIDNMKWSGWEQIADITDDHVMPFVMDGNLHIAWPTITKKTDDSDSQNPNNYWEIKINWIRRTNKGWTKKKVSKQTLPLPNQAPIQCSSALSDSDDEITFSVKPDPDQPGNIDFNVYLNQESFPVKLTGVPIRNVDETPVMYPNTQKAVSNFQVLYEAYLSILQGKPPSYDLGSAEFIIYPYEEIYKSGDPAPYYYNTAANVNGIKVTWLARCFDNTNHRMLYTTLLDLPNLSTMEVDNGVSYFRAKIDWWAFEESAHKQFGDLHQAPSLYGFKVSYKGHPLFEYYTDQVILSFSKYQVLMDDMSPTWNLIPIGRFILNAFGDILTALPALNDVPPSFDARNCYANGVISPSGSGLCLTAGTGSFTAKEITQQGFVISSASSDPSEPGFWYFEHPATPRIPNDKTLPSVKAYLYGPINNGASVDWLDIRDNIKTIAVLRRTAYLDFDGLYSADIQTRFELPDNLYLGSVDFTGEGIQAIWPTGFDPQAPVAPYNWEIFYHAPMLIAEFLTKQQRFADAQKWLHYIFNPTEADHSSPFKGEVSPFWRFLPFRQLICEDSLQQLFNWLAETAAAESANSNANNAIDQYELTKFMTLIDDWRDHPFLPFLVARSPLRWRSFEWRTIFAYLDNLIAWGDQMFRRFNRESVNEAIQYYILAAKLLGPRPKRIQFQSQPPAQSYRDLYGKWDDFSNAWYTFGDAVSIMLMTKKPGGNLYKADGVNLKDDQFVSPSAKDDAEAVLSPSGKETSASQDKAGGIFSPDTPDFNYPIFSSESNVTLTSLAMLYFGIPGNDKLMEYWDKVEDQLQKIRNCKDIDGVKRELPLFSPRIDPILLVRATAAGLDIDTVLADMDAPLLPYRFNIIVQKANEICAEVKSLGSALLTALEKKDAEGLALLRSGQEVALLNLITQVKQRQVNEANANIDSLNQSMAVAMARFTQYQKLLGKAVSLDASSLPVLSASSSLTVAANAGGEEAGLGLIQYEVVQFGSLETANNYVIAAGVASTVSGILHMIPNTQSGTPIMSAITGGSFYGSAASAVASFLNMLATNASHEASNKSLFASYQRRQDEWVFQSRLALEEMKQINKQIIAAQIRLEITQKELDNHLKQIDNAQAVDDFMHDKYTNQELYSWMTGQISNVYFTCYQLAYDIAKRAEKTFRSELGLDDSNFIQFGYWDCLKKGLLAGENLSLDLKRMEVAYLEQNRREFEITKHVSLLQLNPLALIQLKETGKCEVALPEALFDIDFPGHYFRRIKSVSLTIPCVAGPYTSVNSTLTLLSNTVRVKPSLLNGNQYGRDDSSDDLRFKDYSVPVQSIATSHGQNDSGMFELNFRDERFLPFEGAGAISGWRIELPNEFRQFDYDTISDVIMHLKYTAREGGDLLGSQATGELMSGLKEASAEGFVSLFSIRHEFPTEWAQFTGKVLDVANPTAGLSIALKLEHFPFWAKDVIKKIAAIEILAKGANDGATIYLNANREAGQTLEQDPRFGDLSEKKLSSDYFPALRNGQNNWPMNINLFFDNNQIDDLWLAVTWSS